MDAGEKLPKWFTIGVLLIFTGYIAIVYDFIFLRHLIQQNILLGVIIGIIFNLFAFLTYKSYYMTIVTSPVLNARDLNGQYAGEIEQIKAYTKKSNAINHTRRLRKHRYLFDTSKVQQQQLAYCDDITDLFDNQQKINQQNNDENIQSANQQAVDSEKHKTSYVNEPNDDFEGRRQQVQQNVNPDKEITINQNNNSQNVEIFTEEEYQKFDVLYDLTQVKYCFKCQSIKLPRVHHCKVCNRCISRMDHHCPWVANCVGKENQKFFSLLLLYGGLCGLMVCLSVFIDYIFYDQVIVNKMSDFEHQYTTIAGSASFPAFLVAFGMFLYQIVIACKNLTTLEANIDGMYTEKNPFRRSSMTENIKEVFGERMLYWFIPVYETYDKQKNEGFIQLVRD